MSKYGGFPDVRDVIYRLALRGEIDQRKAFDVLFEGELIVFYDKQIVSFLFFNEISGGFFLGMEGVESHHAFFDI